MKLIRYAKAGYILTAAALVVLGVILAVWPEMSTLIIGYAVGVILLVCGIVRILGYFSNDLFSLAFQFDLALGLFTALLGAVFIAHPTWLSTAIPFLLGAFVLVNGLFTIQTAIDSKKFGMKLWWVALIFAVIESCMGLLMILNPFSGAKVLMIITGIAIVGAGVENLFIAFYTIVTSKKKAPRDSDYIEVEYRNVDK